MNAPYHEFRGDQWLSQSMVLRAGSLRLVADDYLQATASPVAYARAGKKATVYKVSRDGRHMAMKVFKKRFALKENILTTIQLNALQSRSGLSVCARRWIDASEAESIGEPGLAWAILMPWIEGDPWTALIESKRSLTQSQCLALARNAASILASLEADEYVHADISSTNVFVQNLDDRPRIELIDVEDMYHPGFFDVPAPPDGTAGYAHPQNTGRGCRNPFGDRFAGGVLLAEMITWHLREVRAAAVGDSLFAQNELCWPGPKFEAVIGALDGHSAELGALFRRLWWSSGLDSCPTLAEWKSALADANPVPAPLKRATLLPSPEVADPQRTIPVQNQTALLKQSFCTECKEWIPDFAPSAHAPTCSRHPNRLNPALPSLFTALPRSQQQAIPEIGEILKRYTVLAPCPYCGVPVSGPADSRHAVGCASDHRLLPPDPGQEFLPISDQARSWPGPADFLGTRFCPECGRLITRKAISERGHKLSCPNSRFSRWWNRT